MFRGPIVVLLLRLGAVAAVYALTRFLFAWLNADHFPEVPWASHLGGLRFDASAIAWTNALWVIVYLIDPAPQRSWLRKLHLALFLLPNAVALFFQFVDLEYFPFNLKRSTADFLSILTAGDDTRSLAPAFIKDYWYIVLLYLVAVAFLCWSFVKSRSREREVDNWSWRIGWRAVAVVGIVIASRGGVQLIPLQPLDGARYGGANVLPVTLNTPFTMLMSWGKPTLADVHYMTDDEAERYWPVHHLYTDSAKVERPNVVVIILESFSAQYSARLSGGPGYMPFLDSLMGVSLNMTRAYANGRRSIDGIPAILASIPELMNEAFITSPYASRPFTSLASVLGPEGYHTSFFHGGRNGTMGFDGFVRSAGFDRYVGLNEYIGDADDMDGHWGVRDRPFLQFYARSLGQEQQPFLSAVFTLSSHHPYELPAEEMARFKGGTLKIHPTLRYADDALRAFFATASQRSWFSNTLFVITADHTADIDRDGQHYNKATDYWVPLLYHMPGRIAPQQQERVTQHIDILPTVLDLVGHGKPFFSFGHSALRQHTPPIAIMASNGIYQCVSEKLHLQFDGHHVVGTSPLSAEVDTTGLGTLKKDMTLHLSAAIQQFNSHLRNGDLVHGR
ncbi:MAG: LTA synthase family protein [Flavobacteriales bacterium]|nr:LTA synthase family protein [Flavobacteriales bacterium]